MKAEKPDQDAPAEPKLLPRIILIAAVATALFTLTAILWADVREVFERIPEQFSRFWGATIVAGIFVAVAILVYFVAKRSLWELLELLIVSLVLAGVGYWFAMQQEAHQNRLENKRAQAASQMEEQRAQDVALQGYLDQMSSLLQQGLRGSDRASEMRRTLARARTLTVLSRLDGERKGHVVEFLFEANLITERSFEGGPIVILSGADLSDAKLRGAVLWHAVLGRAQVGLQVEQFAAYITDMRGADLSYSDLEEAELGYANMNGAHLEHASMDGTKVYGASLNEAHLQGAYIGGTPFNVSLKGANLKGVTGKTNMEICKESSELEGTIMPNGQTYEEWFKSEEGRMPDEDYMSRPRLPGEPLNDCPKGD